MFSSLRSRLWLSYALVIFASLFLTLAILALFLARSPLVYRSTLGELEAYRNLLLNNQPGLASFSVSKVESALKAFDQAIGVRLVLLDVKRQVLLDTRAGETSALVLPRNPRLRISTFSIRDEDGKVWLYVAEKFPDGRSLFLLKLRPRLPLLGVLRSDLSLPFFYAGSLALLLSLFVAFGLARWIGNPLQALIAASKQMPAKKTIPLLGPREVQELTSAYNEMSARVIGTQKAQKEFVANVSHELKTPITSIQGFSQALQDGTIHTPDSIQQAAAIIQQESGRMYRMVVDLLDLARLDSGTLDLARDKVDVGALLRNLAEKFSLMAQAAGVQITVQTDSVPVLIGDGDRLGQVFANLLDNAIKFTPAGGNVHLRAGEAEKNIQVEVIDSGMGINEKDLPKIFERFYRADPSRSGGEKHGTGLGLAIAQEIIHAQGGTITVRSIQGKGTTFTVRLPIDHNDDHTELSKRKKCDPVHPY